MAGPRAPARLVQVGAIPVARRARSPRRPPRVRARAARPRRGARLGFDVRDALPRAAGAPGGYRGHERVGAGRARHARLDDRRRQGEAAGAGGAAVNGVHDMGGMHGMGPIVREANEPVFHHDWERRVLGLNLAAGALGAWNIDTSRHARKRIPPAQYLAASYYQKWLYGLELLLLEQGLVTGEEIATGRARGRVSGGRVLRAADVEQALTKGRGFRLPDDVPPRFKAGDRVVARNTQPTGHTRLPRYARGRRGVIDRDHGVFIFADANAMGHGPRPQHLYSVRFAARELWGPDASPRDAVYLDLWDDHLDPA